MAEVIEEQSAQRFDLQRYLDIVRRRHIQFLIPLFCGWLLVWSASWFLQARYKSATLILVEQPTMPKNYVVTNVSDNLQDRLQSITEQILSRTRLLAIINSLNLYNGTHKRATEDEKVDHMRKDIDIELVRDSHGEEITAFKVSYSANNPRIAQLVTSELTDLFISENLKVRQQESENTTNFIKGQLETARAALADQEAKVRQFQGAHQGELPTQQAGNLQILGGLQEQLQSEQSSLNTAKQQRVYFQSLIDQYRAIHGTARTVDGGPTSLALIDQDLDKQKAKLADLRSRYTDRHPDVQSLMKEIARTEKQRDDFIANAKNKANNPKPDDSAASHVTTDPTVTGPLLQLQGQLQANQIEISNREQSVIDLKTKINQYQARLNAEPASEQQLADLTRGYEQSKAHYDELLGKKNSSEMATDMEQMQQGERFRMIDAPSLPTKPDFPNRLKFCGIGLFVGIALGVAVAGAFEFADDRMHSQRQIEAMLPIPIISEIPDVLSPWDERTNIRKMRLGWALAAVVLTTILSGSAFSYLRP